MDEHRTEFPQNVAIKNIERLLAEREPYYCDNDLDLNTEDRESAAEKLRAHIMTEKLYQGGKWDATHMFKNLIDLNSKYAIVKS